MQAIMYHIPRNCEDNFKGRKDGNSGIFQVSIRVGEIYLQIRENILI